MFERIAREGRARVLRWNPDAWEGQERTSPLLIQVDTTRFPAPPEADVVLGGPNVTKDSPSIQSLGTWFHEVEDAPEHPLALAPVQPVSTDEVQVLHVGDEWAVWHDASGWVSNPTHSTSALIEARRTATEGRILWAPNMADPSTYALWVLLGIDAFDDSPLQLAAIKGQALTIDGPVTAAELQEQLGEAEPRDAAGLYAYSLQEARQELARIRRAIGTSTLRPLAERRAYTKPWAVEWLRRVDREYHYQEEAAAGHRKEQLVCMTSDSLHIAEVERFRRRLREEYLPPESAKILVLLPCSATKPYITSPTHRYLRRAIEESRMRPVVHEVMVTSPLGVVPRELEEIYPAQAYDVPVTGMWTEDEKTMIRKQVQALLARGHYTHVISHAGAGTHAILADLLPEGTPCTSEGRPASIEDCKRLTDALAALQSEVKVPNWSIRSLDDAKATLSYQMGGDLASRLVAEGAKVTGKPPYRKLFDAEGNQLGATNPGRGMYSLTLESAKLLSSAGKYRVHIGDFTPKGTSTLFAVGVEDADPEIRSGDEVVLVHGDEVRGVGIAQMHGAEMASMKRGVAVSLRRKN